MNFHFIALRFDFDYNEAYIKEINTMDHEEKYKYQQIENYIYKRIRSGEFSVDSLLPTQEWFCEYFQVSRTTVNVAFKLLVENGLVEKVQGSGSYVRTPKLSQQSIYMSSFSEQYTNLGYQVTTKLIFYAKKRIEDFRNHELPKKLGALPRDQIHYFERVRFGDGKPFAVQYTYILEDQVKDIPLANLKGSIYSYIENNLKLPIGDGSSFLSVILPPDDIAMLLKVPKTEPVIYISHISRLSNGVAFEYVDTYSIYNKFSLLYTNKRER